MLRQERPIEWQLSCGWVFHLMVTTTYVIAVTTQPAADLTKITSTLGTTRLINEMPTIGVSNPLVRGSIMAEPN